MKWFDPHTWDLEQQKAGQITRFYEHFKEPLLGHANFQLNFCLKRFKKFKNYIHVNHEGKKAREIRRKFYQTGRSEYPNLVKVGELILLLKFKLLC